MSSMCSKLITKTTAPNEIPPCYPAQLGFPIPSRQLVLCERWSPLPDKKSSLAILLLC